MRTRCNGLVEWIRPETDRTCLEDATPLTALAAIEETIDQEREATETVLLRHLEQLDPEVAAQTIYVFSDRAMRTAKARSSAPLPADLRHNVRDGPVDGLMGLQGKPKNRRTPDASSHLL